MTDRARERLARELRHWAGRPTSLSPRMARRRVLAHLPSRRRRPARRLIAAAALGATALALVLTVGRRSEPIAEPPPTPESAQRLIVHQLSSGTKLYIVLQPGGGADGS